MWKGAVVCFGVIFLVVFQLSAFVHPTDSLLQLLQVTRNPVKRCEFYVHLADLHNDSTFYWEKALHEAISCGNGAVQRLAFDRLCWPSTQEDTVQNYSYYMKLAEEVLPDPGKSLFISYLRVRNIWYRMDRINNSIDVIKMELGRLKNHDKINLSIEEQIEWEFLMALSLDCAYVAGGNSQDVPLAIPYMQRAIRLLSAYPLEQRYLFEKLCRFKLCNLYTVTDSLYKQVPMEIQTEVEMYKEYNPDVQAGFCRPFKNSSKFYIDIYSRLLYLRDAITDKKAELYYNKCVQLLRDDKSKEWIYDISSSYYQRIGDYKQALCYVDSLIAYRKVHLRTIDLVSPYREKVFLYKMIGDYKSALEAFYLADSLFEVTRSDEAHQQLAEMQTLFDMNKLELERANLENQNKMTIIIAIAFLFLCIVVWAFYQRYMLRKLNLVRLKLLSSNKEVGKQSRKAAESEKMKTVFIQSMCHEIRTPLNAISGFTSLLADESLDCETKQEFCSDCAKEHGNTYGNYRKYA